MGINPSTLNRHGRRPTGDPLFNDRLDGILDVDVKAPSTLEERIDYALHLAYHAKRSGDTRSNKCTFVQPYFSIPSALSPLQISVICLSG